MLDPRAPAHAILDQSEPLITERPGNLWLLGRRCLACGAATEARLLTWVQPHPMVTDPRYGTAVDQPDATSLAFRPPCVPAR